ncbi:hypothetical protein [Paramagnetospirillum magneticum]|uniref:Uncharacterized protein n=1 Tax=Paramagnetospirillum magneticum (strain ATCC 700264 / AMB-1) TaxID=342108 RepID=Q2W4I4_PARM1|nr:hypothetical protein [Paramagnetospirillum magneticum]BAE51206.1 hypothetical protein amb2402 [Paramagnetospirillum magneticum AMB-1]BAE51241.1 hypothetical protein amb2437 [Paramagnetospirillum magneticum AMB-1]
MADEETRSGTVVGYGPCKFCGNEGKYQVNKRGKLYFYCPKSGDGGCGIGSQGRCDQKSNLLLAKEVKKWVSPEYRKKYLGEAAAPAEQPKKSIWDMEIKL